MNDAILSEDFLELDDLQDNDFLELSLTEDNFETQLTRKLKSDDYFYRKQAFTETIIYLQNQQRSENLLSLLNVLKLICNDFEPSLRCDLAESLISITKMCLSKDVQTNNIMKDFAVPCLKIFFHDTNKQVRLAGHAALINFIENKLIDKDLFYQEMWLPLEELMISCNPDELRTECFTLLVQISQLFGNCLEYNLLEFSREFISCNDNLRKTCASYLCTIIERSADNFIMEWLEIFYKLSEDTSWYVKKFCIDSAIALSKRLSSKERWNNITNAYYNFLTDNKKWVTSSAYENLGAFVATFADVNKSHLELSADGSIRNLFIPPDPPENHHECHPITDTDTSDSSNYNSFYYWNQLLDGHSNSVNKPMGTTISACSGDSVSVLDSSVSSVCLSIKDIDLNPLEISTRSDFGGIPDLSNYHQDIIPKKLLRCYLNVIHESSDIELIRPCAYSMPAIMFTLGQSCWPYIRTAYIKLVQSISWKVRVSLASSIQHVFQIFKYDERAVNDIIWAYKEFIKDVDEVKAGLMSNIAQLYLSVPIARYSEMFEDFNDLVHLDNTKNWRYRVLCMEQLESVVVNLELHSQQHIAQFLVIFKRHWLPVIFTFVADEVYAVRLAAIEVMLKALQKLVKWRSNQSSVSGSEQNITDIENTIVSIKKKIMLFSDSKNWYLRQLFLQSCIKIAMNNILPTDAVHECLLPKYLDICINDSVPNNRMIGGLGLSNICNSEYLTSLSEVNRSKFEYVYNFLSIDVDRDVRHSVLKLKEVFASLTR